MGKGVRQVTHGGLARVNAQSRRAGAGGAFPPAGGDFAHRRIALFHGMHELP
jgi:hypothetical protein